MEIICFQLRESKSDISTQENGSIIEKSGGSRQSLDELDITKSDKDGHIISDNSKLLGDGEPEIVSTPSDMQFRERKTAESAQSTECSSSGKFSSWETESDAPGGARFGSCQEVQKLQFYRNCHLVVDTSQDINDVPYGDYFSVEGRWDVEKGGDKLKPGCILRVYIYVAFSKKTMWRGKIVQSTAEECREAYAIWIDLAHAVLKQKNLEKEQVLLGKQANTQNFEDLKASNASISRIMPDMKDVQQLITNPQDNLSESSARSLLGDTLAKISAFLRYQNVPSLLVVIVIVLILVTQISILVLLSKPQQIHAIPQADYTEQHARNDWK